MEITPSQRGHNANRITQSEPYFGPHDDGVYGTLPPECPKARRLALKKAALKAKADAARAAYKARWANRSQQWIADHQNEATWWQD